MKNPLSDELYHSRVVSREPDLRGDYFRDQTAIVHATPFRRLKHKTQVFFSPQNDHICTRIEHVLHVSTIATTLCKGLNLDVELSQAIALGHDLGHAPFGHSGEQILNRLASNLGGFIHEVHSLRVVDKLTREGRGLNLTYAVRDGIVSHCGESFTQSIGPSSEIKDLSRVQVRQSAPLTYEGCVVRVADIIAYLGRDIEDAVLAGVITIKDIPEDLRRNLGQTNGEIIDTLVMDVVRNSSEAVGIAFSDERFELICRLRDFNYASIYRHPVLEKSDTAIRNLMEAIYAHLSGRFAQWHLDAEPYCRSSRRLDRHFGVNLEKRRHLYETDPHPERSIIDFIAGMTDDYAMEAARELLFPVPVGV